MLLVDSAEHSDLQAMLLQPGVSGFTTNPTLLSRASGGGPLSNSDYISKCQSLCRLANEPAYNSITDFMIQAFGNAEDILSQAELYLDMNQEQAFRRLWIKLLPTPTALSTCKKLKQMGLMTLVTAVFTAAQAHVAMEAGADGIAVYFGRMRRLDEAWRSHVEAIAVVMGRAQKMLLMASFPDLNTVQDALEFSSDLTVPPSVLAQMLTSSHSSQAIEQFDGAISENRYKQATLASS